MGLNMCLCADELKQLRTTAAMNILENAPDMIFVKDMNHVYVDASRSFARLVRLDGDPAGLIGQTDKQIFNNKEIVERYLHDDRQVVATKKPIVDFVETFIYASGKHGYCKTSKYPIFDDQENVIGIYGISRDITFEYMAKIHYEQELKALFELPEDALGAALFDITAWRIINIRTNSKRAKDYEDFTTIDEYLESFIKTASNDKKATDFYLSCTPQKLKALYENGTRQLSIEYELTPIGKQAFWVRNVFYLLLDPVTGNLCLVSILHDIDKKKQAELALIKAAQLDSLTGVLNRETTIAKINDFLSSEGENGTHMLFMVDIDNFKLLNDTLGHQTGDRALLHIANEISKLFEADGIVGRIGGDEFFALLKNVEDEAAAKKKAHRLVEVLQYECANADSRVSISGSIGISKYSPLDKKSVDVLYAEADSALYRAKQLGKNRFVFADEKSILWEEKTALSTVNLRMLLENADAAILQTEFFDGEDISVTYSSHSLFSEVEGNNAFYTGARVENVWESIFPEDLNGFKMLIKASTITGDPLDISCRVKTKEDKTEWRHICGSHLPLSIDGAHRMIHVVTDITKQKQIEAELREKNSIIDFAMKNTDINLWYFDYQTRSCQLTQSCQIAHEMLGVEQLDNFPTCLIEDQYVREDCHEQLKNIYDRLSESGESLSIDVWFKRKDTGGWWCERETISPLIGADGKITRGIGIGKDVTSEKLLEEKYESFGAYRRLAENNTRVSIRLNLTTDWAGDCMSSSAAVKDLYPTDSTDEFFALLRNRIISVDELELDAISSREALLKAYANGESLKTLECRFKTEDGESIWVRIMVEMLENPLTGDIEALLYSFDIDREKNMQFFMEKLLDDDYEFLGLIDVATQVLMVFGKDALNPDTAQNGAIYESETKRIFKNLIPEEYYGEAMRTMAFTNILKQLEENETYICSFPAKALDHTNAGRKQWKFSYLDSTKTKLVMTRTDITSLYTAEYDSLTGIFNKEAFYRHVREFLNKHEAEQFLIVRFDIDHFKVYNDIYGIHAGDKVLNHIGRGAREGLWGDAIVCGRLEADHFAMLVRSFNFDSSEWIEAHSEWIKTLVSGYHLTSSAGVYPIVQKSLEVSIMCDRALLALSTIKESYTKKLAWYDERQRQKLMREQVLSEDMEQAIKENQFVVYFQPQVNYNNNAIIGAEALVRWKHPERGIVPPKDFIPLFEKNGFITRLDGFVWKRTCEYLKRWIDMGLDPIPVSVNVSRHNLYDPRLCQRFIDLINCYNIPRELLNLEITESAYMNDPKQLMEIVIELRKEGFIVEMDDFGAGYSSLNMLKDMPVDILKLDTVFISKSEDSERATSILSSIVSMAHKLGLMVIAEGVETKSQADDLLSIDCTLMQGYYFGRPMPSESFEKILVERKSKL